jgi:hypothetical protein
MLMMKLPDILYMPICTPIMFSKNLDSPVEVIYAYNEHADITNKFNLFLRNYWDKDLDAFDFLSYADIFKAETLFCNYIEVESEELHSMMIYIDANRRVHRAKCDNSSFSTYVEVPFACVEF